MYFDKDGAPISMTMWGALLENDEYRTVAQGLANDGSWVSTVWIGMASLNPNSPDPLIFETAVFKEGESPETVAKYPTLAKAALGHEKVVAAHGGHKPSGPTRGRLIEP